jgi:hypothetical protein
VADPWPHCASSLSGIASPWGRRRACLASTSSSAWLRSGSAAPSAPQARLPSYRRRRTSALSASAQLRRWGCQAIAPLGPSGHHNVGRRRHRVAAPWGSAPPTIHCQLSPPRHWTCCLLPPQRRFRCCRGTRGRSCEGRLGGRQPTAQLEQRRRSGRSLPPSAMPLSPSLSFSPMTDEMGIRWGHHLHSRLYPRASCYRVSFFPIFDRVCVALPFRHRCIVDTTEDEVFVAPSRLQQRRS